MASAPPLLELALGKGEWIVGHGRCGGDPALFLEPATEPHTPGDEVVAADKTQPNGMPRGGLIISFADPRSLEVVKEAIARLEGK